MMIGQSVSKTIIHWAGTRVLHWAGTRVLHWAGTRVLHWAGTRVLHWAGTRVLQCWNKMITGPRGLEQRFYTVGTIWFQGWSKMVTGLERECSWAEQDGYRTGAGRKQDWYWAGTR